MNRSLSRTASLPLALLLAGVLLAGCASPGNRMNPTKEVVNPPPLDLGADRPHLAVAVRAVIVNRSAGSWKLMTWWDEYYVSLRNPGTVPVVVERVDLMDFSGRNSEPGADPWALERASQEWWKAQTTNAVVTTLALGAGAYATVGVAYYTGLATTGTLSGGAAVATGTATALAVALPVALIGSYAVNQNNRAKIEAEFQRRRLSLPLTLAPGESREGSLFFPVSPGPQRMLWRHQVAAGDPETLVVELAPLAALHFKQRRYFSAPAKSP